MVVEGAWTVARNGEWRSTLENGGWRSMESRTIELEEREEDRRRRWTIADDRCGRMERVCSLLREKEAGGRERKVWNGV
ncbi:hypothetical protein SESBI_22198 [Sesbania bispinosa]|nr:hypothetical protein SESBI_22198 [Sesbania bispinosa]